MTGFYNNAETVTGLIPAYRCFTLNDGDVNGPCSRISPRLLMDVVLLIAVFGSLGSFSPMRTSLVVPEHAFL